MEEDIKKRMGEVRRGLQDIRDGKIIKDTKGTKEVKQENLTEKYNKEETNIKMETSKRSGQFNEKEEMSELEVLKSNFEKKLLEERKLGYEEGKKDAYEEIEKVLKVKSESSDNRGIPENTKQEINEVENYKSFSNNKDEHQKPSDKAKELLNVIDNADRALEFGKELSLFMSYLPKKMYHAFDGIIQKHIDLDLYFESDGKQNFVRDTIAILDSVSPPLNVYLCSHNKNIFNIVKPTGIFSITGLKTIAIIEAKNEEEFSIVMESLEKLKKREN